VSESGYLLVQGGRGHAGRLVTEHREAREDEVERKRVMATFLF